MGKLLSRLREALGVLADTAQLFGVDWRAVLTFAAGTTAGASLIGLITGATPFQFTVVVAAVGFLAAGASALSRYRKPPVIERVVERDSIPIEEREEFKALLRKRVEENRQTLFKSGQPTPQELAEELRKPRIKAPPGKEQIQVGSLSFHDLGDMIIGLAEQIRVFQDRVSYNVSNQTIVNNFLSRFGKEVFWLYGEAERRGLINDRIAGVRDNPGIMENKDHVSWLQRELEKFGHIVKLYS
jgi:hypothetical protein